MGGVAVDRKERKGASPWPETERDRFPPPATTRMSEDVTCPPP